MTRRYLQLCTVLFFAASAASAGAAQATIDVPERPPPRQDLIDSRSAVRQAEVGRLTRQLQQERQKLSELRQRFTDQHPDVMSTSRKIADLEARLLELGVRTTPPERFQNAPPR
jgi:hypothetical protein